MKPENSVINVVGTEPIPELDKQYNQWYDEVHIPMALKHPDVLAVTRYQILEREGRQPHSIAEFRPNYGKYLTIYRYANEKSYRSYANSAVRAEVKVDTERTWTPAQLSVRIRAAYLSCGIWAASRKVAAGLIRVLGLNIDPPAFTEFKGWFGDVFVTTTLKTPFVLGLSCHELLTDISGIATVGYLIPPEEGYPNFLVIINFENTDALNHYENAAEVNALNEEITGLWKPNRAKVLICVEYQFRRSWSR